MKNRVGNEKPLPKVAGLSDDGGPVGDKESDTKSCSKCGQRKPLSDFHKKPGGIKGRHSQCKVWALHH